MGQVLSRLVRRGTLLRAGRGIYVRPVESRYGTRAPSTVKMVEGPRRRVRRADLGTRLQAAEARAIIAAGRGKHFDPDITDAFLAGFDDFVAIAERYREAV